MPNCKFYEEKEQVSHDSGTSWSDTGNYRKGELYEYDSPDCNPPTPVGGRKWVAIDNTNSVSKTLSADCDTFSGITHYEIPYSYKTLIIGDCVKTIEDASIGAHGYNSVIIGDNVIYIGTYAFNRSNSCDNFTIPSSVEFIDTGAFHDCSGLTGVTFESVTPPSAFYAFNTTNLPSLDISYPMYVPSGSVGDYATILYDLRDAFTCEGQMPTPPQGIKWKATLSGGSVVTAACEISSAITSLEVDKYRTSGLTKFEVGDCVKVLGRGFLHYTGNLTSIGKKGSGASVELPDSLTTIEAEAFINCNGLKTVTIPSGVTYIGDSAFAGCSGLTSITLESPTPPTPYYIYNTKSYFRVNMFENTNNCPIIVPCESVDAYKAAWSKYKNRICCNSPAFTEITYTASSEVGIKLYDFDIKPIYSEFSDGVGRFVFERPLQKIGMGAFSGQSITSINIPDCVTEIGQKAFYSSWLKRMNSNEDGVLNLPSSLKTIEYSAFDNCKGFTSVNIPNGVTSIDWFAFVGTNLTGNLIIPDSVTSIGRQAFAYCDGFTNIVLGRGAQKISDSAFTCANFTCLSQTPPTVSANAISCNCVYVPRGCVKDYKSAYLWGGYNILPIESPLYGQLKWKATYSDGREISAFCDTSSSITKGEIDGAGLISVEIGDCVKYIENNAFAGYSGLTSVVIGNNVTSIGGSVFFYCTSLTSVTIGNSVTSIGGSAFYQCTSLSGITIPNSVKYIGSNAFYNSSVKEIIVEPTIPPEIDSAAFSHLHNDCIIYVPCSGITFYKRNWYDYRGIITCR